MRKYIKIKLINYMLKITKWTLKYVDKKEDIARCRRVIKKLKNRLEKLNEK